VSEESAVVLRQNTDQPIAPPRRIGTAINLSLSVEISKYDCPALKPSQPHASRHGHGQNWSVPSMSATAGEEPSLDSVPTQNGSE